MDNASRDQNFVTTLLAVSSVDGVTPVTLYANPTTHRLLVDLAGGGSGTVQTVAVATANGFAGTSDGNAAAPTLTLTTSVTGVLYGNGTAMSALTIGSGLSLVGSTLSTTGGGSGTVTDVSVVTANGVSGSVATSTTTPAITLTLGAITPSGVQVSGLTASEIVLTDASKNLVSAAVATYPSLTELTYLKGVTSAIQTQLNAKGAGTVTSVAQTVPTGLTITGSPVTTTGTLAIALDTGYVIPLQTTIDGKANTALSNLASVAINTSLISDTDSTDSIGSTGVRWLKGWFDDMETTNMPTVGGTAILTSLTAPQFTTIELGHATENTLSASGGVLSIEGVVIPSISSTNTLTNKRITKRTGTTTSSATPTINTDNVDEYYITAQTEAITSFTTNLSGTPTEGQLLFISIKGTAARAVTWGASFGNGPVALPTTTTTTLQLSVLFKWNSTESKWLCYASGSTV